MNLTRESILWWVLLALSLVTAVATLGDSAAIALGIPASALPYVRLVAFLVAAGSTWAKTSPFPSKHDDPPVGSVDLKKIAPTILLAVALGAGSFSLQACAKVPPNTNPVVARQQQIVKVLHVVQQVGLVVEQVQIGETNLYLAGQVPLAAHTAIQATIKKTADTVLTAVATLQAATDTTDPVVVVHALSEGLKEISLSLAHLSTKQAAQLAGWIDTAAALIEVALA